MFFNAILFTFPQTQCTFLLFPSDISDESLPARLSASENELFRSLHLLIKNERHLQDSKFAVHLILKCI